MAIGVFTCCPALVVTGRLSHHQLVGDFLWLGWLFHRQTATLTVWRLKLCHQKPFWHPLQPRQNQWRCHQCVDFCQPVLDIFTPMGRHRHRHGHRGSEHRQNHGLSQSQASACFAQLVTCPYAATKRPLSHSTALKFIFLNLSPAACKIIQAAGIFSCMIKTLQTPSYLAVAASKHLLKTPDLQAALNVWITQHFLLTWHILFITQTIALKTMLRYG